VAFHRGSIPVLIGLQGEVNPKHEILNPKQIPMAECVHDWNFNRTVEAVSERFGHFAIREFEFV